MLVSDKGEKFYEYTAQIRDEDLESELERSISEDFSLFSKKAKRVENFAIKNRVCKSWHLT